MTEQHLILMLIGAFLFGILWAVARGRDGLWAWMGSVILYTIAWTVFGAIRNETPLSVWLASLMIYGIPLVGLSLACSTIGFGGGLLARRIFPA